MFQTSLRPPSVHRLFGDESDLQFWSVASHYLQAFAQARLLSVPTAEGQQQDGGQPTCHSYLDICHDTLCESSYFQVMAGGRARVPARACAC